MLTSWEGGGRGGGGGLESEVVRAVVRGGMVRWRMRGVCRGEQWKINGAFRKIYILQQNLVENLEVFFFCLFCFYFVLFYFVLFDVCLFIYLFIFSFPFSFPPPPPSRNSLSVISPTSLPFHNKTVSN